MFTLSTHFSKRYVQLVGTLLIGSVLSACGGGGASSSSAEPPLLNATSGLLVDLPADTISQTGMVLFTAVNAQAFTQSGPNDLVGAYGAFDDLGSVMSSAEIESQFAIDNLGECEVMTDSSQRSQATLNHGSAVNSLRSLAIELVSAEKTTSEPILQTQQRASDTSLEAGGALSITTPAGSWPDLVLKNDFGPYYEFEDFSLSLGDLPSGSTLSIPGGQFPAFDAVPLPTVTRFTGVSISTAAGNPVTTDTRITWSQPGNQTSRYISAVVVDATAIDPETNAEIYLAMNCTVSDVGEFSFPAAYADTLAKYQVSTNDITLVRIAMQSAVQGNAAVITGYGAVYFFD